MKKPNPFAKGAKKDDKKGKPMPGKKGMPPPFMKGGGAVKGKRGC